MCTCCYWPRSSTQSLTCSYCTRNCGCSLRQSTHDPRVESIVISEYLFNLYNYSHNSHLTFRRRLWDRLVAKSEPLIRGRQFHAPRSYKTTNYAFLFLELQRAQSGSSCRRAAGKKYHKQAASRFKRKMGMGLCMFTSSPFISCNDLPKIDRITEKTI